MLHTSDTLYFKEYNLVIKYVLPLKLELTGFIGACPLCHAYISTSYEHWINTKYVHFNTCHVLISKTMSTKQITFITTPSIIHDQDFVFNKAVFAKIAIF